MINGIIIYPFQKLIYIYLIQFLKRGCLAIQELDSISQKTGRLFATALAVLAKRTA
jgi:hypothetical protein